MPPPPPLPKPPPLRRLALLLDEFGAPAFVLCLLLFALYVARTQLTISFGSAARPPGGNDTAAAEAASATRPLPGAEPIIPLLQAAASSLHSPYYQAGLRPLLLSLGPRHPIRARRAPYALFADVRLPRWLLGSPDDGNGGNGGLSLAALLSAASRDGSGGPKTPSIKIPEDALAYELFEEEEEEEEEEDGNATTTTTAAEPEQRRRRLLTCFEAAKRLLAEPFHPSMLVRNRDVPTSWAGEEGPRSPRPRRPRSAPLGGPWRQPPHPHPTKLSASLWRWDDGAISRASFDAVPRFLGSEDCPLCYDVVRYKLHGGKLYRWSLDCRTQLRDGSGGGGGRGGGNGTTADDDGAASFSFSTSSPSPSHLLPAGHTRCGKDWMRGHALEEILLVAIFLYRLPNADIAIHRGDGAATGYPVLQANIARDHPRAGFALPYPEHWVVGGGPPSVAQAAAWASCTRARYGPLARRPPSAAAAAAPPLPRPSSSSCARAPVIPRAVWRGSTTDPRRGAWLHQVLGMSRARLHVLSLVHRDVLDARLVSVAQMDEPGVYRMAEDKAADELLFAIPLSASDGGGAAAAKAERAAAEARLASCGGGGDDEENDESSSSSSLPRPPLYLAMEDFSRYAAVLDIDGNGWSARLWALLLGASASRPLLKQASAHAAYYEHLFAPAPGRHLAHFRADLRDVADVARRFARLVVGREGGEQGEQGEEEREGGGGDHDDHDDHELLPSTAAEADRMAREASALAALTLNKWAMVESAAAALEAYGERTAWQSEPPRDGDGWERVPFSLCCGGGGLPAELLRAMAAAD
jgi:hypothetical protein